MASIVDDARVRTVLSTSALAARLEQTGLLTARGTELVYLDLAAPLIAEQDTRRLLDVERGGQAQLAYIIYTHGADGRPAGVAIGHASICNFVKVAAEVYGIPAEDRVYQGMTIAFDFSVEEIWVPWAAGATLVPRPGGPSLLGRSWTRSWPPAGSPRCAACRLCWPPSRTTCPTLRFLLVSGESCPQDLVARWHRPGRRFLNVYGPTEATVTATWTELHPGRPVTIGVPLPTYSVLILDPEADRALTPRGNGRDRDRGHRPGRRLPEPARADRAGLHPRLPGHPG